MRINPVVALLVFVITYLILASGQSLTPRNIAGNEGNDGATSAGVYEIRHDTMSAGGWFGGDNRPGSGPRHVGSGQAVRIDTPIVLRSFAFHFRARFDWVSNPSGVGHEVTLLLNVRDSTGFILSTSSVVVPDTFQAGWVTWSGMDIPVEAQSILIFTAYLVGAYDSNQFTSSQSCDASKLYTPGEFFIKEGMSDAEMELWSEWSPHGSWDSAFWLTGDILVTGVGEGQLHTPNEFSLQQNYPNPFNPSTTIRFSLPNSVHVQLKVYNLLGQEVATLVDEILPAGSFNEQFEASGLASGIYLYRIQTASYSATRKLIVIR